MVDATSDHERWEMSLGRRVLFCHTGHKFHFVEHVRDVTH
jgi:hypothetical protein